jgi:hypothetical protein
MTVSAFAAIFARILLRWGAGFLVAKGLLAPDVGPELASDVDVQALLEVLIGFVMAGAAEGWFALAKRRGWAH